MTGFRPGQWPAQAGRVAAPACAGQESILSDHYRSLGDEATAAAIEEEFFWHLDASVDHLRNLGRSVVTARFSPLSWGMEVILPQTAG